MMARLRVAPIVEGHGEYECIRILLERIWRELLKGDYIEVIRPIRQKRGQLVQREGFSNAVSLAVAKLNNLPPSNDPSLILALVDADQDCPGQLGPKMLEFARESHSHADVACVVVKVEYETWFVAAAESLRDFLEVPDDSALTESPEDLGLSKGWIEQRFKGTKYSETQDQPAMTRVMDLSLCRARSLSFDKLCRELERRLS